MLYLLLRKSQMAFDWNKPAEKLEHAAEPHHKAYDRVTASGKLVHVEAKGPQAEGREQLEHGMKIMYRTPEMPRRRKGTITGSDESGWHVTGQRQGNVLKPSQHVLPREQIWTIPEHEADRAPKGTHVAVSGHGRVLKPEIVRERAEKGYARLGISEGKVLTHPEVLRVMKNSLNKLARTNSLIIEPGFNVQNGMIVNDSPESMDAYEAFMDSLFNSFRRQTAQAPDEMLDEFRDHLMGKRDNSRIFWTGIQDGETAALRYVKKRKLEHHTHEEFNTSAEGDYEAGMREISSETATPHHEDSDLKRRVDRDNAIEGALAEMHPKAAELLRRHFGLGDYQEPQSTAAIAREMGTTKEKVEKALTLSLQAFAATKGSSALREFLKSLREELDFRKALVYEEELQKSHIKQYARMDGTVVQEHQDKRIAKHPDLIAHENAHGDKIHTGADLKHGENLQEHLKSRGWKQKEVSAVRKKDGAKVGKKEDMPEPSAIKGKNQENSALQSAQRTIHKMHEAVKNGSDPVASLQAINTSRGNPYLAAVDDEKKKLLEHFGHETDDGEKQQKFDKDGHTVILADDGKKVAFAGGDIEAKGNKPVGSLTGKKEIESTDTGKKQPKFITGRHNTAYTAKMNEVKSNYALVEAHDLTASHTIQGHVNKAYPQEIQPRERERVSSQMQMANIMNDLKPELFGHSATASDGAPIVGKDGAVESGNGRTIALSEAYNRGLADKYKEWLKGEAEHFGLKPEDVEGMKSPMLVRVRDEADGNKDRAEFAREANQSSNLGSSPAEQAWTDADRIDDSLLKKFTVDEDGEIYNDDNMPFITAFLGKLGKNEAASLQDADGEPNKKCIERIQNAVFAKVYGSSVLTEFQAESAKPRIRNVLKALNACVGDFAQVKGHDDLDVIPDMMEAIEYTLSHQSVSRAEMEHTLKNAGALNFTGDTPTFKTDFAVNMILAITDRTGSRNRLQNVFKAISNEIRTEVASRENPEVDMFSGPAQPKTKEQVVKTALEKQERQEMQKSVRSGAFLLRKAHGGAHGRTIGRRKVQAQAGAADAGARDGGQAGRGGREEGSLRKAQSEAAAGRKDAGPAGGQGEGAGPGQEGRGAGAELIKAHVVAYNRTTHSGALVQVLAHEDSRVSGYGARLAKVKNQSDLHKLRTERFGHLPHWGGLDEQTRQHVMNAEDHIHDRMKAEEFHKKLKTAIAEHSAMDTIDRSGWGQTRLFKALLQKSMGKTICVDFDGVIADYSDGFQGVDVFGKPIEGASKTLHELHDAGVKIIIFTTRQDTPALRAYLEQNNIPFDEINRNSDQPDHTNEGKPIADAYVDDRAVRFVNWPLAAAMLDHTLRKSVMHPAMILRKSQMSLFDWVPPKHEDEREVRATTRHLASGAVVAVKKHERKVQVAEKREPVGTSLKHSDENYRYKDVGHVPGSRKELAAEQATMIKQRAKTGAGVDYREVNWDALEENPREAYDLITKDSIAKEVDWDVIKASGVEPGAGFLMYKLYAAVAPKPEDSPQARKDFVFGINALQERFTDCKTPQDVVAKIREISEEMTGFTMNPEQQKEWERLEAAYREPAQTARRLSKEHDAVWNAYYKPSQRLQSLKWDQEKRVRRGWKKDPELEAQIDALQKDVDTLYQADQAWRTANQAAMEQADKASTAAWKEQRAFKQNVININVLSHPLTRGWNSFGKKFFNAINYSSYKGSDAFGTHVATARSGKVQNWDWLEKDTKPRAASKTSVQFQLKVAENVERIGGDPLPKTDYGTDDIKREFNLANVQSGNWVLKDLNAAKHHTEQCAMAFQDMADILGIPNSEISMNGRLSVAFGARGSGGVFGPGAAAHYETKYRVINLTKMKGGGSLAHEWLHFLDDVAGEIETGERKGRETYATDSAPTTPVLQAFKDLAFEMENGGHNESIKINVTITEAEKEHWLKRVEQARRTKFYGAPTIHKIVTAKDLSEAVQSAFDAMQAGHFGAVGGSKAKKQYELYRQMAVAVHAGTEGTYNAIGFKTGSKYYVEAQKIDAETKGSTYWQSRKEMAARAFAAYVSDKLHERKRENTYLSSYADNKYYVLDGIKPYPEGEERTRINAAFDKLFATIKTSGTLQKAMQNYGRDQGRQETARRVGYLIRKRGAQAC
jgi:hypothetical protein